jgi:hypothetical protein
MSDIRPQIAQTIRMEQVSVGPQRSPSELWGLLASGQTTMRKVDGWETLAVLPAQCIDLAA